MRRVTIVPALIALATAVAGACRPHGTGMATASSHPEPCPTTAVPLSAGGATFVDSTLLEHQGLGRRYRFVALGDGRFDVFIYPASGWSAPDMQARLFVETLDSMRQRGDIAGFEITQNQPLTLDVKGRGRRASFRGHTVSLRLHTPSGPARESYFAVFPYRDRYVKFRVTHFPDSDAGRVIGEFVRQLLSSLAARAPHCPL